MRSLSRALLTDTALKHVGTMTNLTRLTLNTPYGIGRKFSDVGIEKLATLTNLTNLDLTWHHVTARGIAKLAGLKKLKYLMIGSTRVRHDEVNYLKGIFPSTTIYK